MAYIEFVVELLDGEIERTTTEQWIAEHAASTFRELDIDARIRARVVTDDDRRCRSDRAGAADYYPGP